VHEALGADGDSQVASGKGVLGDTQRMKSFSPFEASVVSKKFDA
jgi:hypothetical protein